MSTTRHFVTTELRPGDTNLSVIPRRRSPTVQEVAAAFAEGRSAAEVAARWGCTARTVRNIANDAGLVLPRARRRAERDALLADEAWLRRRLIDDHASPSAVAHELATTTDAVRTAAAKLGIDASDRTERSRRRFTRLYDDGWLQAQFAARRRLADIAAEVGCSIGAVRGAAERVVPSFARRRRRPRQLDDSRWLRSRYVARGRSAVTIARELDCSAAAVSQALRRAGLPLRRRPRPVLLDDGEWLRRRYLEDRSSTSEIAAELGTAAQTVSNALHRAGIPARPPGRHLRRVDR